MSVRQFPLLRFPILLTVTFELSSLIIPTIADFSWQSFAKKTYTPP
jgi:hypothetical protein